MIVNYTKHRFGVRPYVIGARVNIPVAGGRSIAVEVRDLALYPQAKTVVRCMACKSQWPTMADCIAGHASQRELEEREEAHPVLLWSDDVDNGQPIGALSTMPWASTQRL